MLVTDPIAGLPDLRDLSPAQLDQVIAEFANPELRPTPAHQLARALAYGIRFERGRDPGDLTEALHEFTSSRYRGPARGIVGRGLVLQQLVGGLLGLPVDPARIRVMIDEAGDDPTTPGTSALLSAMTDIVTGYADDPSFDRAAALARIDGLAESIPPESEFAGLLPTLRMALAVKRGGERGNYADAVEAAEHARAMLAREDLDPVARAQFEVMLAGAEGMAAAQRGETSRAADSMLAMTEMIDRMPPGPAADAARRLLAGAAGAGPAAEAQPGLSAEERAWRLMLSANGVLPRALERRDPAGIAQGIRVLREAAGLAPPGYVHRPLILSMLGQALTAQASYDEAQRFLTAALREAAHPGHPVWASTAMALSQVHRMAGRTMLSRESGQSALRGHAWSVLLQAGTDDATSAARDAADDAKQVARWCLLDGDPAAAALALDAGRCLLLYAATVTMDIPARLRALDRGDLLDRWRRDSSDGDLRAEVLTALTGAPLSELAVPDVLDPPPLDEVGRALIELRADVLVYLLPGDDRGSGCAVLVAAGGRRPAYLSLPRLTATGPVTRHLDGLNARDAGVVGGPADLDQLCAWAWAAAIGPLLGVLDGWRIGRAPRIVLIPMGDLAAVPWHAALDRDGTRAVEIATFSYAASARLLCQGMQRPPVPPDAPVLIVGDPTGDLPDAQAEAIAVRAAFYPQGDMLQTATPDAVREWLLAGGGTLLHLACHGAVRPGPDGSHLSLAGGRLTARDILLTRQATEVGLVALAACTTGVPSGAYDEAFSLATAFLATGARSVFGSLWPVPSDATSLLMFMAHHYLRAEGKRPVDALNHAQRWMLDPDRVNPPTMPDDLARVVISTDPVAWAGFTHHGR